MNAVLSTLFAAVAQTQQAADNATAKAAEVLAKDVPTTTEAAKKATGLTPEQATLLFEKYGVPFLKALVLLVIGWLLATWISGLIRKVCERAHFDVTLGRFFGNLVRWLLLAAVIITCLSSFGVEVTSLVALLGTIGVAIGLALQGSLSHIASGVMLLIFRPFKVGDAVTAGGQSGIVDEIGLFSTLLATPDNRRIIVPNGAIVSGVILNATHFDERLVDVVVQTTTEGSHEAQRAVLSKACDSVAGRITTQPAAVALTGIGATNTWNVSLWCKTSETDATKEQLLLATHAAIAAANIAPPAPIQLVKSV